MNILILMGSHRKKHNTDNLIESFLEGAKNAGHNIEKINLIDLNINLCKDCCYCKRNWGKCIINDDMNLLFDKFKKNEGIVLATPVYFNSVSTISKMMIDRCQMTYHCKYTHKKSLVQDRKKGKGILFSIGGARDYPHQFDASQYVANLFFKNLNYNFIKHLKINGTDYESIKSRDKLLEEVYILGKDF